MFPSCSSKHWWQVCAWRVAGLIPQKSKEQSTWESRAWKDQFLASIMQNLCDIWNNQTAVRCNELCSTAIPHTRQNPLHMWVPSHTRKMWLSLPNRSCWRQQCTVFTNCCFHISTYSGFISSKNTKKVESSAWIHLARTLQSLQQPISKQIQVHGDEITAVWRIG